VPRLVLEWVLEQSDHRWSSGRVRISKAGKQALAALDRKFRGRRRAGAPLPPFETRLSYPGAAHPQLAGAHNGAKQDVIFRQEHPLGRLGSSDFTDMADQGISIGGAPLDHRLYQFRLAFSD